MLPPGILAQVDPGPATTVLEAERGRRPRAVDSSDHIVRLGVTCALCHSTVDNSVMSGIGRRKDGWPNRDLNVGAIIALSPVLSAEKKAVYASWGPGKYDPRYNQDGKSTPLVLPPAYGLAQVENETYTAEGPISYWNAYVAVTQMGGKATSPTRGSGSTSSIHRTWSARSSLRCAPTSIACLRLHLRAEASTGRSQSVDVCCSTGRAQAAMSADPAQTTTTESCIRLPRLALMVRTRRAHQAKRIAPHLSVRSGSTRRTSTTAAQRLSRMSWRTTIGSVPSASGRSSSETSSST